MGSSIRLTPADPPEALTQRERTIVVAVAVVCAASRFLAVAKSLWDWDEVLFCLALRDYDVTEHHPHPPGFPAYIAMAKLMRMAIDSDFRALQALNLIAAVLVFPAMFLFAREVGVRFRTAVIAAVLFAFFPNVWFFGGTAFSDVPSIVLVLFAATFLLRGVRSRNWYWLGTLLLAVAIGIRPQNVLVGLVPGVLATLRRRPYEIAVALLIGIAVCGAAFGGAIYATGSYEGYVSAVRHHGDYISRIDSFLAPSRTPLWRVADRFFVKQYQVPLLSVVTTLFVIASIVGAIRERNRALALNALTFGAFAIFAWLMLDRFSVSRFSIGYQPMFALFAADGIARVMRTAKREIAFTGMLLVAFVGYTAPALAPARNEVSPTVTATQTAMRLIVPARDQLYVAYSMVPFVQYFAPGVPFVRVLDDGAMPLAPSGNAWLLAEITESDPEGFYFHRERVRLWNIARRHYFEVFLKKLEDGAQFVSGWHERQQVGIDEWRGMASRSVTSLPPARGRTQLRLVLNVPPEALPHRPRLTVTLNGRVLATVPVTRPELQLDYDVMPAPNGARNVLQLSFDDARPRQTGSAGDHEEKLTLRFLSWAKA